MQAKNNLRQVVPLYSLINATDLLNAILLAILHYFGQLTERIHGSTTNLGISDSVANSKILEPFNDL